MPVPYEPDLNQIATDFEKLMKGELDASEPEADITEASAEANDSSSDNEEPIR